MIISKNPEECSEDAKITENCKNLTSNQSELTVTVKISTETLKPSTNPTWSKSVQAKKICSLSHEVNSIDIAGTLLYGNKRKYIFHRK